MHWRTALFVTTLGIAALYGVVVLIALIVSGAELLQQPLTYYAALMPFVYFGVCMLTATGHTPTSQLRAYGIIAHIAVAPCLAFSFLRLGLMFPILAFLWYRVYQWRRSSEEGGGYWQCI